MTHPAESGDFHLAKTGDIHTAIDSPQPRSGSEAAQAMAYSPAGERASRLGQLVSAAHVYHLDEGSAQDIVNSQVEGIRMSWNEAAEAAHLTQVERDLLWGRQILNSFIFS